MRIWLTGQVDMRRFQQIIDAIPEGLATLSPVPIQQLASYPVRIAVTFEEPILFIAMTVWAISRSSDSVSGEIGRGTMEILAAQPTRRTTLLAIQAAVTTMGVAVLAITAWAGIAVGIAMFSAVQSADPLQLKIPLLGWHIPLGGVTGDPAPIPMRLLVDAEIFGPPFSTISRSGSFLPDVARFCRRVTDIGGGRSG